MLSPEVPSCSGSVSNDEAEQWTPELLQAVINNYGLPQRWEGQAQVYKVVAVDEQMREAFEKYLTVEFTEFTDVGQDYVGGAHVDLPLNFERGSEVSDLTARFYFRQVNRHEMALVLLDIHML